MSLIAPYGVGAGLGLYGMGPYTGYNSGYYPYGALSAYRYGASAITTPWTRNWYGPSWGSAYAYPGYGSYGVAGYY